MEGATNCDLGSFVETSWRCGDRDAWEAFFEVHCLSAGWNAYTQALFKHKANIAVRGSLRGIAGNAPQRDGISFSLSFVPSRVLSSQCMRRRTFWVWPNFNELHYNVSVRLDTDSDSARHTQQRRGPSELKHIEKRCLGIQQWITERLSVGRVNTKDNTADLFMKPLDRSRTRSLARIIGLQILGHSRFSVHSHLNRNRP